jgi:hypothetical protein
METSESEERLNQLSNILNECGIVTGGRDLKQPAVVKSIFFEIILRLNALSDSRFSENVVIYNKLNRAKEMCLQLMPIEYSWQGLVRIFFRQTVSTTIQIIDQFWIERQIIPCPKAKIQSILNEYKELLLKKFQIDITATIQLIDYLMAKSIDENLTGEEFFVIQDIMEALCKNIVQEFQHNLNDKNDDTKFSELVKCLGQIEFELRNISQIF